MKSIENHIEKHYRRIGIVLISLFVISGLILFV